MITPQLHRSWTATVRLAVILVLCVLPVAQAAGTRFSHDTTWPKLPEGWVFRMACAVAGDSQGRIYVVHRGEHPIVYFDRTGNFLGSIGEDVLKTSVNYNLTVSPPTPISREYWLHGLHIDREDNVWVTDLGRHVVMKFNREGKLLLTLGTMDEPGESERNFNQPTDVAVGPSGDIYVSDGYGNSRVVKFSAEGRYIKAWGQKGSRPGEFDTPHGIDVDSKGNVYVAERKNNRVQVFDKDGGYLNQWPDFPGCDAISITRKDEVYVGTGRGAQRVFLLDLSGTRIEAFGATDTFGYPHGLFVDSDGSFYVADPVAESASRPPRKYVPSRSTTSVPGAHPAVGSRASWNPQRAEII